MDTPSSAVHDLEAMETREAAAVWEAKGLVRHSLHKRRLVRTVPGVWRTARPCPSRFRFPTSTLLVFLGCSMTLRDPLNRPMRTRMSGGVAGESGRPLPYADVSGDRSFVCLSSVPRDCITIAKVFSV
jgi:hypothetical protein